MVNEPALMTTAEAARALGVNPETIRRWVRAGLLSYITLPSGRLRFREQDVGAAVRITDVEVSA